MLEFLVSQLNECLNNICEGIYLQLNIEYIRVYLLLN